MRSNTLNVLMQLSRSCPDSHKGTILSHKPVRGCMPRHGRASNVSHEVASNLFYYLFEDYGAGAPILRQARDLLDDQTAIIFQQAVGFTHSTPIASDLKPGHVPL
jgi:hypothetical protein